MYAILGATQFIFDPYLSGNKIPSNPYGTL